MRHITDREQVAQIAAQIGSSLLPDNRDWHNRFTVESASSPNTLYVVAQRRDGVWGCSCWGWKRHRHCKHLADILGRLAVLAAEAQADLDKAALAMLASARTAYLDLDESIRVASPVPKSARYLDL
jgi:hypothetical protein